MGAGTLAIWGTGEEIRESDLSPLEAEHERLIHHWAEHPVNFLGARLQRQHPLTGEEGLWSLCWSKDEIDTARPVKPFADLIESKMYLQVYLDILLRRQMVFIDKPRQMVMTHTTMYYVDWECRFFTGRRCILSKSTEEEEIGRAHV